MGTNIAQDIISESHVCNEQKLWRHVILNAFEDVRMLSGDRKSSLNKCDAHFWISELLKTLNRSVGGLVGSLIMLGTDILKL